MLKEKAGFIATIIACDAFRIKMPGVKKGLLHLFYDLLAPAELRRRTERWSLMSVL
jgi:hypothetical protein